MKLIKLNMGERYRSSNDTDTTHNLNIELEVRFESEVEATKFNEQLIALLKSNLSYKE